MASDDSIRKKIEIAQRKQKYKQLIELGSDLSKRMETAGKFENKLFVDYIELFDFSFQTSWTTSMTFWPSWILATELARSMWAREEWKTLQSTCWTPKSSRCLTIWWVRQLKSWEMLNFQIRSSEMLWWTFWPAILDMKISINWPKRRQSVVAVFDSQILYWALLRER